MNIHAMFHLITMTLLLVLSVAMHPAARPKARRTLALITGLSFMGGYTQALNQQAGFVPGGSNQDIPADGAIALKPGTVILSKGTAGAYTLALPTAGTPDEGGQDGLEIQILSNTAEAHVVTTSANGYNGADDTATFAAAIGNGFTVKANGGIWIVSASKNVTFTEV
jgi:hypothetical protein